MLFALVPEEVLAAAATVLRNADPESAEAQALNDWADINRNPKLAELMMNEQDARAFHEALARKDHR